MEWIKWNLFNRFSPLAMVVVGTAVAAAGLPVVKRTARTATVAMVSGVMTAADMLKEMGEGITNEWSRLVSDARARRAGELPSMSECLHSAGVSVMQKGFEINEMTRNKLKDAGVGMSGEAAVTETPGNFANGVTQEQEPGSEFVETNNNKVSPINEANSNKEKL